MPCYQLIVFAKPEASPEKLTSVFRSLARLVYREQGQFRYIENFGVRPVAYPVRVAGAKYEEVRWVHALYDCAPGALATIGGFLAAEKDVLQYRHLRSTDYLSAFRGVARGNRLKKFPGQSRIQKELFDPATLELGPRLGMASAGTSAAGGNSGVGASGAAAAELR